MSETTTAADPEFAALTAKIARERGFECGSYKEKCLRRRIAVRMRARAVLTFGDYMRLLDADGAEYDRLIDALTINVTKLFRNWDTWAAIERTVLPVLWTLPGGERIRVWSAGCSSGEEPYSIAALLHRHAEVTNTTSRLARVSVLGTDIDRDSLLAAARGTYDETAFTDTPPELRRRYFVPPANAVHQDVRALVGFERRDLLRDDPPAGPHELIICRNVLIYFDRTTQEMLFERFRAALAPGGFLVLGKVETLIGPARSLFVPVDGRERIFRRP